MIDQFVASLVDGLLIGFVYGVAAMGLTLIWGVVRVINLAHGAIIALAMFGLYFLVSRAGLNPYLALVLVALGGLAVGYVVYVLAVHRVINAPPLASLLATFAVNMIIVGTATTLFSTSPYSVNFDLGRVSAGPVTVPGTRIVASVVAIAVAAGLYVFLYRSRAGRAIRAVANNRDAAELMGIPSSRVLAFSFGLGTMLAAVAGGLIATFFPFTVLSGDSYQLKSFVIVVLGGLGNPIGALIGGLVLGSLEGVVPVFMSASWVPVIEFGLFVVILLIRPNGLFGTRR
ncbi:MAG: branched-chain amino acid ABC transporter permease [Chloroflexota bacterium]